MKQKLIIGFFVIVLGFPISCFGQYYGSRNRINGIHCDSNIFVHWATEVIVNRGQLQAGSPELGSATFGENTAALGKADNDVVSLGDGGSAILSFPFPIQNGQGADFAVFENAFDVQFLELAHVEVSSNGINYYRFPGVSNTQNTTQVETFGTLDASKIRLLAGVYPVLYGVPFDLDSLPDHPLLDKNNVLYVKLVDVVGSIDESLGSVDSRGNLINDPWPTPFPSGGFDLDAIGVIHDKSQLGESENSLVSMHIWPNPAKDYVAIGLCESTRQTSYQLTTLEGILVKMGWIFSENQTIELSGLSSGVYVIQIETAGKVISKKLLKQ